MTVCLLFSFGAIIAALKITGIIGMLGTGGGPGPTLVLMGLALLSNSDCHLCVYIRWFKDYSGRYSCNRIHLINSNFVT